MMNLPFMELQNMINSNPHISRLLKRFRIKPSIDTKTLNELTNGHMNETCNIAMGVYSSLSDDIKTKVKSFACPTRTIMPCTW